MPRSRFPRNALGNFSMEAKSVGNILIHFSDIFLSVALIIKTLMTHFHSAAAITPHPFSPLAAHCASLYSSTLSSFPSRYYHSRYYHSIIFSLQQVSSCQFFNACLQEYTLFFDFLLKAFSNIFRLLLQCLAVTLIQHELFVKLSVIVFIIFLVGETTVQIMNV